MLVHLSVKNFAVVKHLDVNLEAGLTAITGETGAGKSIAIDALSLCMGERADAGAVRSGASKAEIIAHFNLTTNRAAKAWLDEHELADEDDIDTAFIRRVVSIEGRSKAFVNGTAVSLQQLKQFGQTLLAIHGQNTHLQLLREDYQRQLVDSFAKHPQLLQKTAEDYKQWRTLQKELATLTEEAQQRADREQLLTYQVEELNEFALEENEFSELEIEHKRLSHSQTLLEEAQISAYHLYESDEFNALGAIQKSADKLSELEEHDSALTPIVQMLNEAAIQVEEAARELRSYSDQLEIDPFKLQQVEKRYSQAMELARKHNVMPEYLYTHHQSLSTELAGLSADSERLESLEDDVQLAKQTYLASALKLSESRIAQGEKLATAVVSQIQRLNMPDAQLSFDIQFNPELKPTAQGLDTINIKVSTNKGQNKDRLDKVVSGGELSRIGLAIQVIASDQNATPTMIFDEVDTGISGPTASIVGQLLRQLGKTQQVMCVTHLPQVAAQAHNQLFVTKISDNDSTETHMLALTEQARVDELARLLAGDKVTESALANARELLANTASN